jgi:deoxyadenosine/deoxycytidine kinase
MFERKIFVVGCCGIPGVGKSSALKRFEKTGVIQELLDAQWGNHQTKELVAQQKGPKVLFVREPTKEWRSKGWLAAYYADQDQEAACFQLNVFDSHVRAVEAAIASAPADRDLVLIQERTMYDQQLFWQQQIALGFRTATPHYDQAYQAMWSRWRHFVPEPNVLLLFQTSDIQMTMRRVKARARAEEMGASFSESENPSSLNSSVNGLTPNGCSDVITNVGGLTTAYQERLLDLHQQWFSTPAAHPPGAPKDGVPCVHINVDAPFHVDNAHLRVLAQQVVDIVVERFK